MVGRAGRAGLDSSGESILIIKPTEQHKLKDILSIPEDNCCSNLFSAGRSNLMSFLLSMVGLQLSNSQENLMLHVKETLYGIQNPADDVSGVVEDTVNKLLCLGLISHNKRNQKLSVTCLGTAVMKSGIDGNLCSLLQEHLKSALKHISLLGHLHLLFLVTPYDFQDTLLVDPHVYYSTYMMLSNDDRRTAALIGISEASVTHLMAGRNLGKNVDKDILHRFYLTLAVNEVWQQKPLADVASKFNTHKGTIHNLITRTAAFASSLLRFTQALNEFWALADLLPNFVKQLQFCCQKELLPLMVIPAVKQGRARQLYQAGYKTVVDIAKAEPQHLSRCVEHLPRKVAYQIISAAKMLLFEQAETLQEEAADLVAELESKRTTKDES